jgi:hypothetical protein
MDMNEELQKKVNEVVEKMEKGDDGKWSIPDEVAKDLSPELVIAVTAERRFRDTQGSYTRTRQELKQQQAIADGLQERLLKSEVALTKEQKYELNELKKTDPEKWRAKLNEYEQASKNALENELEEIRTKSASKGELEVRKEQMAAWSESTGLELNDTIIENELPPKYLKDLEAGNITFEDFLEQAGKFLTSQKVIKGSNESADDDTKNLSKVAGGPEPSNDAQEGDFNETYEETLF